MLIRICISIFSMKNSFFLFSLSRNFGFNSCIFIIFSFHRCFILIILMQINLSFKFWICLLLLYFNSYFQKKNTKRKNIRPIDRRIHKVPSIRTIQPAHSRLGINYGYGKAASFRKENSQNSEQSSSFAFRSVNQVDE